MNREIRQTIKKRLRRIFAKLIYVILLPLAIFASPFILIKAISDYLQEQKRIPLRTPREHMDPILLRTAKKLEA